MKVIFSAQLASIILKDDVKGNEFKLYKKIDNVYKDKNHYITKAVTT